MWYAATHGLMGRDFVALTETKSENIHLLACRQTTRMYPGVQVVVCSADCYSYYYCCCIFIGCCACWMLLRFDCTQRIARSLR